MVYFVSCISRTMGKDMEKRRIHCGCLQAGWPKKPMSGCLFLPTSPAPVAPSPLLQKVLHRPIASFVNKTIDTLWDWSKQRQPAHCARYNFLYRIHCKPARPYLTPENQQRFDQLKIIDSLQFATDILLPRLTDNKKERQGGFPSCMFAV